METSHDGFPRECSRSFSSKQLLSRLVRRYAGHGSCRHGPRNRPGFHGSSGMLFQQLIRKKIQDFFGFEALPDALFLFEFMIIPIHCGQIFFGFPGIRKKE
jgi:hypothetical protein